MQLCAVQEDNIYDMCSHFYTIRKLQEFKTKYKIEILCRLPIVIHRRLNLIYWEVQR